jgi:cobalt-zinc-cadmium efflux system protein
MTEHGHKHHHHGDLSEIGERRLLWAVGVNLFLTAAQVVGGLISGSLSLVADALHNFSDAASLLIALVAVRIGRKPPDKFKTFGYKRAETVAALVNLTTLTLIGFYLLVEAFKRFYSPEPIEGWIVILIAAIALVVDVFTAFLTYAQSKHSLNIRAAFLHNLTDALASVGVIVAGTLILLYEWVWVDAAITLLIAGYVLWQSLREMPQVIHLLMEGAPEDVDLSEVLAAIEAESGVGNAHHLHVWQLDESRNALEAHVVLNGEIEMDLVKASIKEMLRDRFRIHHSTLEFENNSCQK